MNIDFITGYEAATEDLGREGDYQQVDWSAPYQFLKKKVAKLCESTKDRTVPEIKYYEIKNFQHDSVKVFESFEEAKAHVNVLHDQYLNENFYIVELNVVYKTDA